MTEGNLQGKIMIGGAILCTILIVIGLIMFPTTLAAGGVLGLIGDALILSAYALAGWIGPLATFRVDKAALRQGVLIGVIIGLWFTADILIGIVAPLDSAGNAVLGLVEFGGLLIFFIIAGFRGAQKTDNLKSGVQAAMWSSIIGTLIWFIMILLTYYLFIGTPQEARSLQSDQVIVDFQRSGMSDLRAFIMQDYMGGGFFHSLLSPIVAAILGLFGGVMAKWVKRVGNRGAQLPRPS